MLILSLSLFSQGFLLSVSKSLQKVEDEDMLLTTFNLGKTLQNGNRAGKRGAIPLLKHYKAEESFLDEEDDRNTKFFVSFQFYIFLLSVKQKFSYSPL